MCEDQPLRLHDLAIAALEPVVDAFGRTHADPKEAARPNVRLLRRYREAARRSLPVLQVLGIGPTFEDEFTRRIEQARDDQLILRRFGAALAFALLAAMFLLLLFQFAQILIQTIKTFVPETAIVL